ncbi:MAG: hypothetical protein H0U29_11350, partial [Acidimicrobiia bacterium]|nr:hypothetical protein [Acidimicrobiia bacterium]
APLRRSYRVPGLGSHYVVEVDGCSSQALGDEAADSEEIQEIMRLRQEAGLDTVLIDHSSSDGDGHLTIDPAGSELVESLYTEQIDRVANGPNASTYTEAREQVYDLAEQELDGNYLNGATPDTILESAPVQEYLDQCREDGVNPDPDEVGNLVQGEVERLEREQQALAEYCIQNDPRTN